MEGGKTNERPGTDRVISGPMRGLTKNCTQWRKQTYGHGNSMTELAQWGRFSEHYIDSLYLSCFGPFVKKQK